MARRKFTAPYIIRDGLLCVWYDDSQGSTFGGYPEPTRWLRNIKVDDLLEALNITSIGSLNYALSRLSGHDDIERLKRFCDEQKIEYEYIEE